jgi:hypothetical protein
MDVWATMRGRVDYSRTTVSARSDGVLWRRAVTAAFALVFLVVPEEARALGPVDVEVAALVGGGTNPSYAPTLFGFGAGGRAGVAFFGVYLGVAGTYYAGGSAILPITGSGVADSTHTALLGGEAGYTFRLGALRVRPLVELGVAELTEAGSTRSAFYVEPGFTVLVPIGPLFVGFDLNGILIPSYARPCLVSGCAPNPPSSFVGFTFQGQLGVRF